MNSDVNVEVYPFRLDKKNAGELIRNYDIVVDGCDNFATRYLLNDVCNAWGKPYVYGAIQGFEGQVSVFCYGEGAKTIVTSIRMKKDTAHAISGQIGYRRNPAIVGSVEANEVLKLICGYGEPLAGKLWTIDLRTMQSYILSL